MFIQARIFRELGSFIKIDQCFCKLSERKEDYYFIQIAGL